MRARIIRYRICLRRSCAGNAYCYTVTIPGRFTLFEKVGLQTRLHPAIPASRFALATQAGTLQVCRETNDDHLPRVHPHPKQMFPFIGDETSRERKKRTRTRNFRDNALNQLPRFALLACLPGDRRKQRENGGACRS